MGNNHQDIWGYLEKHPQATNQDLYLAFDKIPKPSIRREHNLYLEDLASRTTRSQKPKTPPIKPNTAGNKPNPTIKTYTTVDETMWGDCVLRLSNGDPTMTPQICDKIRDFLDKKEAITSMKVDESVPFTPEQLTKEAEAYLQNVADWNNKKSPVPQ